VPKRPKELPDWFEYFENPNKETHNNIYNSASIYIVPALVEGFGLTVGEAMICGCAVIATRIDGYSVLCKDNETAMMCDAANSEDLARIIVGLISDRQLRIKIATEGHRNIGMYTWERSYSKMKSLIQNL
jgi:glycosyltransferase involved in cell wall biosynthesis